MKSFTAESSAAILAAALAWRMAFDAYDTFVDGYEEHWADVERKLVELDATIRKAEIKDGTDDSGTTVPA